MVYKCFKAPLYTNIGVVFGRSLLSFLTGLCYPFWCIKGRLSACRFTREKVGEVAESPHHCIILLLSLRSVGLEIDHWLNAHFTWHWIKKMLFHHGSTNF